MKDDLSAGEDFREKAAILLEKLQNLIAGKKIEPMSRQQENCSPKDLACESGLSETNDKDNEAFQEIRRDWEDLANERDAVHEKSQKSRIPPPNPRKLG